MDTTTNNNNISNTSPKKLGRVELNLSYTIDLEDQEMIQTAKECLYEDIEFLVKNNELWDAITIHEDPKARESDISSFLIKED